LTDKQGKGCVLLKEPERFVLGKIRLQELRNHAPGNDLLGSITQGCLLLLQAVYVEIEDLLGSRQAKLFHSDIMNIFGQRNFPRQTPEAVTYLLSMDPLTAPKIPPWQEHHLITCCKNSIALVKSILRIITLSRNNFLY
jgi:hypothetical protein